jgi:hypothetical protein
MIVNVVGSLLTFPFGDGEYIGISLWYIFVSLDSEDLKNGYIEENPGSTYNGSCFFGYCMLLDKKRSIYSCICV